MRSRSCLPALAPAASRAGGGSGGTNSMAGRQLRGTAITAAPAVSCSPESVVQTTVPLLCSTRATGVPSLTSTPGDDAIASASAVQPSTGPCARHVTRPASPPCAAIEPRASETAPNSGGAPPISCHQPSRKSRIVPKLLDKILINLLFNYSVE